MKMPGSLGLVFIGYLSTFAGQGAAAEIPNYDRVRVLSQPRPISDVELIDRHGKTFRLSSLNGAPAMVFFGFTNCPDVCPMAMQKLKTFRREAGDELSEVAVVLISVDGERDTPARIDEFLSSSGDFIGLTGDPERISGIAREFSAAFFKVTDGGSSGSYAVSHSPQTFLLDRDGRLRAEFYDASIEAMIGVARAIDDSRGPQ